MAPALTQTGEPPNLADTTCHTPDSTTTTPIIPYDNLKEVNKPLTSQETKKKFQPELSSLTNGDCVSSGLAPPACGWAEGRPIPISSPCRSNMDEKPPLPQSDNCNTCVKSEESAPVPVSSNSNMGLQTCVANTASAASLAKGAEVLVAGNRGEPSNTPPPSNQNELLALVGGDFDNVNDIIDTLQRLVSNPELLDAATIDLERENSATQNAPPAQVSEDRAKRDLARLSERQCKLERHRLFLLRRLRRVTARGLGMTISSQLNYLTRHVGAVLEEERSKQVVNEKVEEPIGIEVLHKESMKTMSTSDLISLVRRVEASNNLQRLNDKKLKRLGLPEVLTLPSSLCAEMDTVATEMKGAVLAHVSHDSDATESSSGGESCDESETFNSVCPEYKPIRERAFYKYCRNRGWVASKWMWLQAQIADLDYRILQQQKIIAHIRKSKGAVQLAEETELKVNPPARDPAHMDMQDAALTCIGTTTPPRTVLNGYHPSSNKMEDINSSAHGFSCGQDSKFACARTLGSQKVRRRRYVKPNVIWKRGLDGIPNSTNNVKVSPVYCKCVPPLTCILCIKSRTNNGKVSVLSYGNRVNFSKLGSIVASTHSFPEQFAKVDSGYHPVLSRLSEILQGELYSATLKSVEWRQKNLACKSTSYQRDTSLSSNILLESSMKKKKDKEHKRNGRRKHFKEDPKERITLKLNKSLFTDALEQKCDLKEGKRRKLDTPDPLENTVQPPDEDDDVDYDDDCESWHVSASGSGNSSPCPSPVLTLSDREGKGGQQSEMRNNNNRKQPNHTRQKQNSTSNSYDINNIVIPHSMAAASRVEMLNYKEIATPKWRVEEISPLPMPSNSLTDDEEIEDISDEAITMRHSKCEVEEHKKYIHYYNSLPNAARSSRSRRADSSGTNTPDNPLSPHPSEALEISPVGSPPDTPLGHSIGGSENTTVLTLSLSSLQSSLLKSNPLPSTELEESGSSNSDNSSLKCQQQQKTSLSAPSSIVVSEGGVASPALRTRRSPSTASTQPTEKPRTSSLTEELLEGGRISPFPCRNFPLKEKEYEDLVSANRQVQSVVVTTLLDETRSRCCKGGQSVDTEPSSIIPMHHRLNEESAGYPLGTDEESGRDSPLSELTDSAPEEEGSWNEGASPPPGWTISAVDDRRGGFVLTVQKN